MRRHEEKGKVGEKLVHDLAYNSFLEFWCYPNPMDEEGDKKEICDLLIKFKDTLILVFIKNIKFSGNYKKYLKKSIEKDVNQACGAIKKIKNQNIYIKHPKKELKEKIDFEKFKDIIIIQVHLGDKVQYYPGYIFEKNNPIHIIDKEAIQTMLHELDTIPDFVEYFKKRKEVFQNSNVVFMPKKEDEFDKNTAKQFFEFMDFQKSINKQILISGKEEDLLADYQSNKHNFIKYLKSKQYDNLWLQLDGRWDKFIQNRQVKLKTKENEISYFIDEFVKREILPLETSQSLKLAKELMSFNRLERRILSKSFTEFFKKYENNPTKNLARRFSLHNNIGVALVIYDIKLTEEQINSLLTLVIDSYCIYTDYKMEKFILIACPKTLNHFKCTLLDKISHFDAQHEFQVKENIKKLGWFTKIEKIWQHEKEFPDN